LRTFSAELPLDDLKTSRDFECDGLVGHVNLEHLYLVGGLFSEDPLHRLYAEPPPNLRELMLPFSPYGGGEVEDAARLVRVVERCPHLRRFYVVVNGDDHPNDETVATNIEYRAARAIVRARATLASRNIASPLSFVRMTAETYDAIDEDNVDDRSKGNTVLFVDHGVFDDILEKWGKGVSTRIQAETTDLSILLEPPLLEPDAQGGVAEALVDRATEANMAVGRALSAWVEAFRALPAMAAVKRDAAVAAGYPAKIAAYEGARDALYEALDAHFEWLTVFVADVHLPRDVIGKVLKRLPLCKRLTHLVLSHQGAGVVVPVDAILALPRLVYLDLSHTHKASGVTMEKLRAPLVAPHLTHVYLSNCNWLTVAFTRALSRLPALRVVSLGLPTDPTDVDYQLPLFEYFERDAEGEPVSPSATAFLENVRGLRELYLGYLYPTLDVRVHRRFLDNNPDLVRLEGLPLTSTHLLELCHRPQFVRFHAFSRMVNTHLAKRLGVSYERINEWGGRDLLYQSRDAVEVYPHKILLEMVKARD